MNAPPITFGWRLNDAALRRANGHRPKFAWEPLLRPLIERVSSRPAGVRYRRTESTASRSGPVLATAAPEDEGVRIAPDVRERLQALVGPAAHAARVHAGPAAEALALAHRADAVTVGTEVFAVPGRLRPREEDGFALLVHESVHVAAALEPGADWRRATARGRAEEETRALVAEAGARRDAPFAPAVAAPARAAPRPLPPSVPAPRPLFTAAADREPAPPPSLAPEFDLAALRSDLQRELLQQIRTEFERGA